MTSSRRPTEEARPKPHERDYLERTIETVRNHRDADNCWPQWANIFADEIERCWAALAAADARNRQLEEQVERVRKAFEIEANALEAAEVRVRQAEAERDQEAAENLALIERLQIAGIQDALDLAEFKARVVAAEQEAGRQAAVIELVARKTDSLSPHEIRQLLKPFRRKPFTNASDAKLRAALASATRPEAAEYDVWNQQSEVRRTLGRGE